MKKSIAALLFLTALLLISCTETKQDNTELPKTEITNDNNDEIINTVSTDKNGNRLEIDYNNTNGTATVEFDGKTIELEVERSASGIWYRNDTYELRGKGNDLVLREDGEVIFEHEDEIVKSSLEDKDGQTLDMVFNNTTNEAKIYLKGGEQIELIGQKPASGIWYKNDNYELRGKGDNVELTKNGKTIFKK